MPQSSIFVSNGLVFIDKGHKTGEILNNFRSKKCAQAAFSRLETDKQYRVQKKKLSGQYLNLCKKQPHKYSMRTYASATAVRSQCGQGEAAICRDRQAEDISNSINRQRVHLEQGRC